MTPEQLELSYIKVAGAIDRLKARVLKLERAWKLAGLQEDSEETETEPGGPDE
jgi:hypothetical protein